MTLSDLSIRRPVLTWVMMLALLVFGWLGYTRLGVDQFPDMEFPTVRVVALLEGASSEGIEEDVTDPLEEHLNSIAGLRSLRSTSAAGASTITVEFQLGIDIDVAIQDVRDKVSVARFMLPKEVEPPFISKMDPGQSPILWAPVITDRDIVQVTEIAKNYIKPELETIPGVAAIIIFGQRERNIRIWVDDEALRARGLAANDLLNAVRREHVEIPGGTIESQQIEYTVKTDAEFETLEALAGLIVANVDGKSVYLRDVARVEDGGEPQIAIARYGGKRSVGVGILKQSGANTVAIVAEANARIRELNKILPDDVQLREGEGIIDFAAPIRESVAETQFALAFGALLAVLTVFVFLRRWRPTMIIALAIPLSLIASFGVTWVVGFTLNTMTLLAMALAVGVVIDDAIVVLECIERHREEGEEPFDAASKGARQIAFAATAATVSIAVVFLPVIFVEGIVGNFLGEFGVTVASAVIISLFVALSLTPMLAARVPQAREVKHGSIYHRLEQGLHWLESHYRALLAWTLIHRGSTAAIAVASIVLSALLAYSLPREFFPPADQGLFFGRIETSVGSTLEATEAEIAKVERWILAQPEISGLFTAAGTTRPGSPPKNYGGVMAGMLIPKDDRDRTVQELIAASRDAIGHIPGLEVSIYDMSMMFSSGGSSQGAFSVNLRGNAPLELINELSDRLLERLRAHGGFVDLNKSMKLGMPEVRVEIDREKAASLGVDATSLATTVRAMIGGMAIATFKEAGHRHDIRIRLEKDERDTPSAIQNLYVRSRTGEVIALRNLVRVETGAAPSEITRTDRQRSVRIDANLDGIALGEAITVAQGIADEILPENVSLSLAGQAEAMREGLAEFGTALGLAIVVIYLVLAAQFESFIHPLTVMLALPFAAIGGFGSLLAAGMSINLFSLIGIIMLLGLVTKNSILLVDYANQLRAEGLEKVEAMRRAAPIRMRPVLMTAISMIFGVLPAATGLGPGSETRAPMAVAVAGGMLSSTLLTLLAVPVFYILLDDFAEGARRLLWRAVGRGS